MCRKIDVSVFKGIACEAKPNKNWFIWRIEFLLKSMLAINIIFIGKTNSCKMGFFSWNWYLFITELFVMHIENARLFQANNARERSSIRRYSYFLFLSINVGCQFLFKSNDMMSSKDIFAVWLFVLLVINQKAGNITILICAHMCPITTVIF